MWAAREGRSTLGIPKSVAKKFVGPSAHDAAGAKIAAGIIFVSPDGDVLLLKRAGEEGVDNYVGHWALPGGGAEDGETPEQCADREAAEELGGAAPVGRKRLVDRKTTPNGMVFHTFAQQSDKFTPKLNEEHSAFGWFPLNALPGPENDHAPEPMHPAVKAVLSDGLGMAQDMSPEDWTALRENFAKWTREEEAEPEHAGDVNAVVTTVRNDEGVILLDTSDGKTVELGRGLADDNQPQLATTGNTGIPLAAWNKKRKAKIAQDAIFRACGGQGCVKCGGSGVSPLTKAPMKPGLGGAFDALSPAIAAWNRMADAEAARARKPNACPICGGTGELAGPGIICDECGGSGLIAQDSRKAPEHTLLVRYDGDFSFKGLLAHLKRLGSIGASRTIEARDEDDKIVPFGWDGDGADKIWDAEIDGEKLAFDRAAVSGVERHGLAFDRAPDSARKFDADGRMHVEVSNISRAAVNPYLGREIPSYKSLGLDPDKIYHLLRDPEELQKAVPTFNNLPLLDEHVPVSAASHRPEHVIGSLGTDAEFDGEFLKNSLVVWTERGIKAIESEKKRQISCAYRYTPVLETGVFKGHPYSIKMTAIIGNHACIVPEGRAGDMVMVADGALDPWALVESAILGL
jgi:8-oxo-dGTP pyrophosphatase MutT (NUDIX family)